MSLSGASQESLDKATGEVAKPFELLPTGAYKAVVKSVSKYTNSFKNTEMHFVFTMVKEKRDLSFATDIGLTLKDGSENGGYSDRWKQFLYAIGMDESELALSNEPGERRSYGKKHVTEEIVGFEGTEIIALVALRDDTAKPEGEPYKMDNVVTAILNINGTDITGQDKVTEFTDKAKTTPVRKYKSKWKPANTAPAAAGSTAEMSSAGF